MKVQRAKGRISTRRSRWPHRHQATHARSSTGAGGRGTGRGTGGEALKPPSPAFVNEGYASKGEKSQAGGRGAA